MTVRVYQSTDTGAPTLSGTAGDLITVLDAVLVNGYNAGNPPGAGWTKPFSGTNLAAYRQTAVVSGTNFQYYLKIRDDGPGAVGAQEARARGYEVMTGVSTTDANDGTNLFPTAAQLASGIIPRKSSAASGATRTWLIIADGRTFYMFVLTTDAANTYLGWGFGDFYSLKTPDVGRCMIMGRAGENLSITANDFFDILQSLGSNTVGHYTARDSSNTPAAVQFGKIGDNSIGHANGGVNVGTLTYPNPADSNLYIVPNRVGSTTGGNHTRGWLRGVWCSAHAVGSFSNGDTFTGATGKYLAGRSFQVLKGTPNSGLFIIETSNTWDTN